MDGALLVMGEAYGSNLLRLGEVWSFVGTVHVSGTMWYAEDTSRSCTISLHPKCQARRWSLVDNRVFAKKAYFR